MLPRRTVLSAVGLGLTSLSGCLQDSARPGGGGDSARGLSALPAPHVSGHRTQLFLFASDLSAYRSAAGSLTDRNDDIGESAERFRETYDAVDLESIDRVSAQIAEGDEFDEAVAAVLDGRFDVEAIEGWIESESQDDYQRGSEAEYTWFGPTEDAPGGVFLAVSDRRLVVRTPSAGISSVASFAQETIDAASREGEWFADDEPELLDVVDAVDDHVNVGAIRVPSTTVSGELDDDEQALRKVRAGSLGSSPSDGGVDVDTVVAFSEAPDVDAVRSVLERYSENPIGRDPLATDLDYSEQGTTVHASGTFDDETLSGYDVAPVVRLPLFLYAGSFSGGSGASAPIASWQFDQREDRRIEMVHASGDQITDALTVTYVHDGERVSEQWSPGDGITAGSRYVTEEPADVGTTLRLSWAADGQEVVLGEYTVA